MKRYMVRLMNPYEESFYASWEDKKSGTLGAEYGKESPPVVFATREDATKAIRASRYYNAYLKTMGAIYNSDWLPKHLLPKHLLDKDDVRMRVEIVTVEVNP
jgi:hypothetical protein